LIKKHYDQHIHSTHSYDGAQEDAIDLIVETAMAKGLAGIAITDHMDPIWPDEDEAVTHVLDLPAYESALTEAANKWSEHIRFVKGIELGLCPGISLEICEDVVGRYPYDFVIGGVHYSANMPIDIPPFFTGRDLRDIIDEYYTILLDSINLYKNYDVLSHINNMDRYTNGFAPEDMYMPYIDEILRVAIIDGKGIEINTSAFRYGISERGTPTMPILNRFKELGGEIVTIGSDAHKAADVGTYLDIGEEWLRAAGLRYIAVFRERRPEFIKL